MPAEATAATDALIDLYTAATPNGHKVSVALEELGLPYAVRPVDLMAGAQKRPDYLAINPNGRIPAIVDRGNLDASGKGFAVFESGAILLYLAEMTGQLLPADRNGRSEVVQWLMFQMGGVGPMMGQANVFFRYFPKKIPEAIERYQNESRRLLGVLDARLADREWLAGGAYSIADIANWCWARTHKWSGTSIEGYDHLARWLATIEARPAAQRGLLVPAKLPNMNDVKNAEAFAKAAATLVQR